MPRTREVYFARFNAGKHSGGLAVVIARSQEQAQRHIDAKLGANWKVDKLPTYKLRPGIGASIEVIDSGCWEG